MTEGWIRIYRKILENPVLCKDSDHIAIWLYLLLNATHSERKMLFGGKSIILRPGQLITGRKSIAERFKISESKVQRVLKTFEIEQQIEQQTNNQHRLVTIVNWALYQVKKMEISESEQQDEQPVNNERTTSEQRANTNKNDNNDLNGNNGNKEITEIVPEKPNCKKIPPNIKDVTAYCTERGSIVDPEAFCDFYESKGWVVGKEKMKNWQAAVRTWEKKEIAKNPKKKPIKQETTKQEEPQSRFHNLTEEEKKYYFGKGAFSIDEDGECVDYSELTEAERIYLLEKGVIS